MDKEDNESSIGSSIFRGLKLLFDDGALIIMKLYFLTQFPIVDTVVVGTLINIFNIGTNVIWFILKVNSDVQNDK
jgi:hypothetical protein